MPVLGMFHLIVGALVEDDFLAYFISRANADSGEECGHLIVLILRPSLEGMIVTLRADHADAQENLGGLFHRRLGLARNAEEIRRGIVVGAAARGEQLAHNLVVWFVGRDGVADPLPEFVRALYAKILAAGLPQV